MRGILHLASTCNCVKLFVHTVTFLDLNFHVWIPHEKIANPYFFLSKLSPLVEVCPFQKSKNNIVTLETSLFDRER